MQNKPKSQKAKTNATLFATKDYENKPPRPIRKNKPKTNPNKPNPLMNKINATFFATKDYENKRHWTLGENKPKTNPNKPNFTYPQRHALSYAEGGKTEFRYRMK